MMCAARDAGSMRGLPELNWLERLIGLDFTSNVVEAWGNLDDDTLKLLPHFVDLQSLTLRGNGITRLRVGNAFGLPENSTALLG